MSFLRSIPFLDDILLAVICIGGAIAIILLLDRFGFIDWLERFPFVHRLSASMKKLRFFRQESEPAGRRPASAGTRTDRPRGVATSKIVWILLAASFLCNVVIGMFFWGVFSQQTEESYSLHRRIGTLEQRVPEDVLTTTMLAKSVEADSLAERLIRDFDEISRRLEAIEKEPALELTPSEVDFLRGNDWTLEKMIVLASLTDTDQDGVMDTDDLWPTVPRGEIVLDETGQPVPDAIGTWQGGIPFLDTDEDGTPDAVDACPTEAGSEYDLNTLGGIPQAEQLIDQIEIPFYGCPDGDKDWIPDAVDVCPTEKPTKISSDQNFDGCEDENQDFSQGGVVDYRYVTEKPAYGDSSGKLVGRFTAERTVAGVTFEFLIACEAMGADGAQLPGDTTDHSLVKKWGVCRPVGR